VLYRYRYLALSVFVLTSSMVMLQGYSGIEYYEAQDRLLIETERAIDPRSCLGRITVLRRSPALLQHSVPHSVEPNLLAMTAGAPPQNPSELLASERMKTLMAILAVGAFDWVLIDTPPVHAVTDALILAPSVAGVVYVIGAEMTRRRLAQRALDTIQSSNPRSVTVVLNKVDFARNRYYYSRSYGHQYKSYYASASV
jgi:Mrp family chromosome partitioning ATPase